MKFSEKVVEKLFEISPVVSLCLKKPENDGFETVFQVHSKSVYQRKCWRMRTPSWI